MVVALVLGASSLGGCQRQQLGTTVGGEVCTLDLHASPRSVHPGGHVTLRRASGCDKDHARQVTVRLWSTTHNVQRQIGTAMLGPDGAVTGTVVIPSGTHRGRHVLSLDEETGCNEPGPQRQPVDDVGHREARFLCR